MIARQAARGPPLSDLGPWVFYEQAGKKSTLRALQQAEPAGVSMAELRDELVTFVIAQLGVEQQIPVDAGVPLDAG